MSEITEVALVLPSDGARLAARLYRPGTEPRLAVVIHGAIAVPQRVYAAFARWLCRARSALVLTYDYRDFGASGSPRGSSADMVVWGLKDQPAAQAALRRLAPDVPLWVIGHSFGGQMVPFHPETGQIARMISVCSGPVRPSDQPLRAQPRIRAFWHLLGPAALALTGYLPGTRLGLGADLPAGVFRDWRRWCCSGSYYAAEIGTRLPLPSSPNFAMKLVAASDDALMPPAAVWRAFGWYPQATKRQLLLKPQDYGLKRIGHFLPLTRAGAPMWEALVA